MECVYTFGGRFLAWALGNLEWSQLKDAVSVEGLQASRKALRDFRFLTGNIILNKVAWPLPMLTNLIPGDSEGKTLDMFVIYK